MKKGTCRHFNGVQNETCKAGVRYDDFAGPGLPCIIKYRRSDLATCDRYEEPTDEECEEWEKFIAKRMEMHRKVWPAIIEIKQKHKGQSWQGVIDCPCCGGRLHVSHAAYNGHCHGRCETEGCIAWME